MTTKWRGYSQIDSGNHSTVQRTVYVETENDNYFENNKPAHNGEVLENGFQQWRNSDGLLHRGPAVIRPNGSQEWFQDDQRHRLDGPAVIGVDGTEEWYVNGQRHRLDGPAWIVDDGSQLWYVNGQRHRPGGPAVIWAGGSQEWYVCGQRHRIDGPAVIWIDGTQEWFVRGQNITRNVIHWMQPQNITWPWDLTTQMQFQLTWT